MGINQTVDWGIKNYEDAYAHQLKVLQAVISGAKPNTLLLTEHPAVYTYGNRANSLEHLIWSTDKLKTEAIDLVQTNRGGDITYHGPGQMVAYPIMNISDTRDIHDYLRKLEDVIINTISHWGLKGTRREGKTGIWLENRKIAAIGVAVKRWVTYHGIALNVSNDMNHFSGIVPCGITDGTVTSLELETEKKIPINEVKDRFTVEFWKIF